MITGWARVGMGLEGNRYVHAGMGAHRERKGDGGTMRDSLMKSGK